MSDIQLGLKENWKQFSLLVLVNGFVGGMVGLERTILPQIAESEFNVADKTAILSFIVVFGISKAISNYYTGVWADKVGRRKLLIIGWLLGLPVPFILIYANSWNWVLGANILLGVHQGLTWSSTVVMKIDLVGDRNRGLAMGINESVGYVAVGIAAFLTGWIAAEYGLRPYPFYMGIGFVSAGLLMSVFLIKDTMSHVVAESEISTAPKMSHVFWDTSIKDRNLGSITQAGLVNNLNDGMIWGLFPVLLFIRGFDLIDVGILVAVYPIIWGIGQLITGKLADIFNKKSLLTIGMILQGFSILLMVFAKGYYEFFVLATFLGIGTAIVYPTFLAGIADYTQPCQRAECIGVFRLWRDLGYAIGAVLTGLVADYFDIEAAVFLVAILTLISGAIIQIRMKA